MTEPELRHNCAVVLNGARTSHDPIHRATARGVLIGWALMTPASKETLDQLARLDSRLWPLPPASTS